MGILRNKKVLFALPVLLFAAYTFTKPKPVDKNKIKGTIYVMPKDFLLDLRDGRFAKLDVALQLAPGQSDGATAGGAASGTGESAVGTLPEEPLVREIVTNIVTNESGETLISSTGRKALRHEILTAIDKETDVKVDAVLFPDLTVQ